MAVAAVLEFSGNKHCFLTPSQVLVKNAGEKDEVKVYELKFGHSGHVYLSVSRETSAALPGDVVELNGLYANKLGLKSGEEVILKALRNPGTARRVSVEPQSVDDWEILEQHTVFVETHMLDQVRVVWPGQVLPLWVSKSVCIFLIVVSVDPSSSYAVLDNATEVIVAPKIRNHAADARRSSQERKKSGPVDGKRPETSLRQRKSKSDPYPGMYAGNTQANLKEPVRKMSLANETERRGPRRLIKRQSSMMEHFWAYMYSWLPISDYYTSDKETEKTSFEIEEKETFVLQRHNFVFRTQAMKFLCNPEELLKTSVLQNMPKSLSRAKARKKHQMKNVPSTLDPEFLPDNQTTGKEQSSATPELFQPSMVFVKVDDVLKQTETNFVQANLPRVFYAQLRKLSSPQETGTEDKKKSDVKRTMSAGGADKKGAKPPVKRAPETPESDGEEDVCAIVRVVTIERQGSLCDSRWTNCVERLLQEQPFLSGHVIVPDLLRRQMKLDVTGRVWLQTVQSEPVTVRKLQLFPLSVVPRRVSPHMIVLAFKTWVRHCTDEEHSLVVFQGIMVKFMIYAGLHLEAQLTFTPVENDGRQQYMFLHSENIDDMVIGVQKDVPKDDTIISPFLPFRFVSDFDPMVPVIQLRHLGGIDKLAEQALYHLEACLGARKLSKTMFSSSPGLHNGILLITGPKGSGKTSFGKALCRQLAELPVMAQTAVIDCKPLRGKRVENMQKVLENLFDEAAWRQPAVIFLDDLDVIAGAASGPEAEMSGEALYAAKVAEMIQSLVKFEINNDSHIAVIATSQSTASLHPSLMSSRGAHFIQETVSINPPDKVGRREIMSSIIRNKTCVSSATFNAINMDDIINKTEGFVARDLEHAVNRAIHAKFLVDASVNKNEEMCLTQVEFDVALEGFRPASIRNIQLHVAGDRGWEDVGGLTEVKKMLMETLQWPSKYPQLFLNCPLRLRSGLLLYGAPGTGKTLLAGVVAKECGLNFISIKGPELLSKYIGASEQAVRDLFTRAQSAKPCILFFDEFDSIAPRRGHDSTGVTDRVVNQLLTQLDGVEGLEGVYVLAATSRPDLLDPALLRPGRLDKCLNCGLPNESERVEILKSLTRKMTLADDVNFTTISKQAEYFTGADFKALLYNAQLKAIHEATYTNSPRDSPRSANLHTPDNKSKGGNSFSFDVQPGFEKTIVNESFNKTVLSPVNEEKGFVKAVSFSAERAASGKVGVKDVPRRKKSSKLLPSVTGAADITPMQRVTFIPKLEDGPVALVQEDEDKMLTMIQEIYRRENVKLKSDDQRDQLEPDTSHHMITVNQSHLVTALEGMRPSVSAEERQKYKNIYENFVSSRSGDFAAGSPTEGKRATHA
ncbi:peroxisomal ATPase PEX1-like [Haliotis cracherodii]|uniref:peroxisomal ATPase PEX1-like n=1 Tax=Haliotis cracherodii TaxID=6455 RepID=UPI0039E74113